MRIKKNARLIGEIDKEIRFKEFKDEDNLFEHRFDDTLPFHGCSFHKLASLSLFQIQMKLFLLKFLGIVHN